MKGLIAITLLLFLVQLFNDSGILRLVTLSGVSDGEPYCMICVGVYTKLIEPQEGDLIVYEWRGRNLSHRFKEQDGDYYTATISLTGHEHHFHKDSYDGTRLFEWRLWTTNNFLWSCTFENWSGLTDNEVVTCLYYDSLYGNGKENNQDEEHTIEGEDEA